MNKKGEKGGSIIYKKIEIPKESFLVAKLTIEQLV